MQKNTQYSMDMPFSFLISIFCNFCKHFVHPHSDQVCIPLTIWAMDHAAFAPWLCGRGCSAARSRETPGGRAAAERVTPPSGAAQSGKTVNTVLFLSFVSYGYCGMVSFRRWIGERKFPVGDRGDFIFTLIFAVPTGSGRKRRGRRPGRREGCKSPRRGGAHTVQCGHPCLLCPSPSRALFLRFFTGHCFVESSWAAKGWGGSGGSVWWPGILGHVIFKHCPLIFKSCGM